MVSTEKVLNLIFVFYMVRISKVCMSTNFCEKAWAVSSQINPRHLLLLVNLDNVQSRVVVQQW